MSRCFVHCCEFVWGIFLPCLLLLWIPPLALYCTLLPCCYLCMVEWRAAGCGSDKGWRVHPLFLLKPWTYSALLICSGCIDRRVRWLQCSSVSTWVVYNTLFWSGWSGWSGWLPLGTYECMWRTWWYTRVCISLENIQLKLLPCEIGDSSLCNWPSQLCVIWKEVWVWSPPIRVGGGVGGQDHNLSEVHGMGSPSIRD